MKKLVIVAVLAAAGVAGAYYGGLLGKTPDTKTATESGGRARRDAAARVAVASRAGAVSEAAVLAGAAATVVVAAEAAVGR